MRSNFLDHKFLHWYHVNGRDSAFKSVSSCSCDHSKAPPDRRESKREREFSTYTQRGRKNEENSSKNTTNKKKKNTQTSLVARTAARTSLAAWSSSSSSPPSLEEEDDSSDDSDSEEEEDITKVMCA